jgi:hypothetical protein
VEKRTEMRPEKEQKKRWNKKRIDDENKRTE